MARLLRACGLLHMPVKLSACLTLGLAARDTSWLLLLMHLHHKASAQGADSPLVEDVVTMALTWVAIQRGFRRRGVCCPQQLLLRHCLGLVPESVSRNPAWLKPLHRALKVVDA